MKQGRQRALRRESAGHLGRPLLRFLRPRHLHIHVQQQRGWGASEYLSVLVGLMVVWRGAEAVLALIQEHHDKFTWALMIPY
jgi:hypothetical protein